MNWHRIIDDLWLRVVSSRIYNTIVVIGFISPAVIIIAAVLSIFIVEGQKSFDQLTAVTAESGCLSGDKQPAPYTELTQKYQLPPELKDCRIYGLAWGWSDRKPLVVIVPKDGIKGPQILD